MAKLTSTLNDLLPQTIIPSKGQRPDRKLFENIELEMWIGIHMADLTQNSFPLITLDGELGPTYIKLILIMRCLE